MGDIAGIDARLLSAAIGAFVVACGWLVSELRGRSAARRLRRERERDVQMALLAEIEPYVEALELFDLEDHLDKMLDRMRADDSYRPVVPTEKNDTVFRAVLPEVHVLPEAVIKPVVRYYSQIFAIEAIIDDLRSNRFATMALAGREDMYADYISLKLQALSLGKAAMDAIAKTLENTR